MDVFEVDHAVVRHCIRLSLSSLVYIASLMRASDYQTFFSAEVALSLRNKKIRGKTHTRLTHTGKSYSISLLPSLLSSSPPRARETGLPWSPRHPLPTALPHDPGRAGGKYSRPTMPPRMTVWATMRSKSRGLCTCIVAASLFSGSSGLGSRNRN